MVIATGLEKADIDIVGGESMFFERLVGAVTMGKSFDGFVEHSDVARTLAKPWLNGSADFTKDITSILGSFGTEDVKNLTVSAALLRLIDSGGPDATKWRDLLTTAQRLGVADRPVAALAQS
jgi:hypothetical protein